MLSSGLESGEQMILAFRCISLVLLSLLAPSLLSSTRKGIASPFLSAVSEWWLIQLNSSGFLFSLLVSL